MREGESPFFTLYVWSPGRAAVVVLVGAAARVDTGAKVVAAGDAGDVGAARSGGVVDAAGSAGGVGEELVGLAIGGERRKNGSALPTGEVEGVTPGSVWMR